MLVGAVLLRLTFTDTYTRYVQPGMGKWLIVAGVAIIVVGLVTLIQALRHVEPSEAHGHDHEHAHNVGVGWLLLAPIAALLLVAPPTLGSYGVERAANVDVRSGAAVFAKLKRGADPVPLTLLEYVQRSFEHEGASFRGVPVQLTGFVADAGGEGFLLARYQIACCAADARPTVVRVLGTSGTPPRTDTWVTVTGTFRQSAGDVPALDATTVAAIEAPDDPYE
jgi:uncharacterized repeat protein (TIGR03943 family)